MRIKNILVPIDFSPCAMNAMHYAAKLARKAEAELIILNVAEYPITHDQRAFKVYKNEKLEAIEQLISNNPDFVNIITSIKIDFKSLKQAMFSLINESQIDLVVMGTKGVYGLFRELAGTKTYGVLKDAKVPFLIVPNDVEYREAHRMGFAADLKEIDHHFTLDMLLDFIHTYNAELDIFHVREPNGKNVEHEFLNIRALDDYFSDITHEFYEVEDSNITNGMDRFVRDHSIDMLSIMPRKHNLFDKIIKRSTTREVTNHALLPILVLPE